MCYNSCSSTSSCYAIPYCAVVDCLMDGYGPHEFSPEFSGVPEWCSMDIPLQRPNWQQRLVHVSYANQYACDTNTEPSRGTPSAASPFCFGASQSRDNFLTFAFSTAKNVKNGSLVARSMRLDKNCLHIQGQVDHGAPSPPIFTPENPRTFRFSHLGLLRKECIEFFR